MSWIFFSSDLIYRCKCKNKHKNKVLLSANFTIINKTGWFEETKYISYPFCRSIHHDGFPSPGVKLKKTPQESVYTNYIQHRHVSISYRKSAVQPRAYSYETPTTKILGVGGKKLRTAG